jgi:aspartyl-tRNA(Asn)/glutamyl-tRNA(Gln) amidotransferase subunit A
MYLADIFTNTGNLAGICGISVPCGFANVDGKQLPIGLQLLGKALDEARLFQIAHAYEQSTDWHKARPKLWRITKNAERSTPNAQCRMQNKSE